MKIGARFFPNRVLSLQLNMKAVRVNLSLTRLFQGEKIFIICVRIYFLSAIVCQQLSLPVGVGVVPTMCSRSDVEYGVRCVFFCGNGYELSGPRYTVCQNDTSWSENAKLSCVRGKKQVACRASVFWWGPNRMRSPLIESRSQAAILDDEIDRGPGKVKKCSREEEYKLTLVVGEGVGFFPPFPRPSPLSAIRANLLCSKPKSFASVCRHKTPARSLKTDKGCLFITLGLDCKRLYKI